MQTDKLVAAVENRLLFKNVLDATAMKNDTREVMAQNIAQHIDKFFRYRVQDVSGPTLDRIIRNIMIAAVDRF